MATCNVHNVKFYKLEPQHIHCMALDKNRKRIAISRSNATIQIWNVSQTPYIERTIPNTPKASIEALCWFENRLFSVGLSGDLIEYDLISLSQKCAVPITGGAGWCMDIHKTSLAIGTEQGYLNLYQIKDNDIEYIKVFDKQEGRIMCLKFDKFGKYIASGSVDTIRIWNVSSGHAIHKMNIGRSANTIDTLVWCLLIVDDFTVVSGDSCGNITFWDGETGSQIESYQSHRAAILSMCLSDDRKTIYCAGVDPLIMSYEQISMKGKNDKWVKSVKRKIHDHDVRNLVFCDNRLYSGGVDGYLACSYFPPKTLIKYPPLLQNPCISLAHESKFILLQYLKTIEVWKLCEGEGENSIGVLKLKEEPKKLLEIHTKGGESVSCSAVSHNGQMIFYSTASKFRLFHFNYIDGNPELIPVDNLPEQSLPCIRAEFTPDNKSLIFAPYAGGLLILELSEQIFVSHNIDTRKYLNDTITFLKISCCGKFIIAADPQSNIAVWYFQKGNWKFYTRLPKYNYPPTALGVHPTTNNLVVAYVDHRILEYSLEQRKFTEFSHRLNENIPPHWFNRSFPVINVTFDPRAEHIILLHDDANIYVIDKKKKLPSGKAKIPKVGTSNNADVKCSLFNHAFHIVKKCRHLVYFGWIADGEMVSVEINPLSLLEQLPPGLETKKFGTK